MSPLALPTQPALLRPLTQSTQALALALPLAMALP